jgi:transposase
MCSIFLLSFAPKKRGMAQQTIAMEYLKQLLQLASDGVPIREMERRTGISRNTIKKYLRRLSNSAFSGDTNNAQLATLAYNNDSLAHDELRQQQLFEHFPYAEKELSKTGVHRKLLWQEYIAQHPDGYAYSHYCHYLAIYLKNKDISMHLQYQPGDVLMVDFAGKHLRYTDLSTGEVIACQVFVSVLPFSGLIFCYAVHSQQTADFIECFNEMLRFYGGVPATVLCDNLKTAVTRSDRYEPVFTDCCLQLSEHYQTTFSATRPYSPRDKAMVERAVQIVYNHIYAPLRNQVFTSIGALNTAIRQQLELLNNKNYKNTPYSRWYYFEQQERASLKELPVQGFTIKKVVQLTVQRNYHIQLSEDRRYYSVPYGYVGKRVKVLYDNRVVEVYLHQERIALHPRKISQGSYSTLAEHMPPNHARMQQIKGWSQEELLAQARQIGSCTLQAATYILQNSVYMEQNYKSCYGMLMLARKFSPIRLEAACQRALRGTRINYTMLKNILERGLDQQPLEPNLYTIPEHTNIRGKEQYQ